MYPFLQQEPALAVVGGRWYMPVSHQGLRYSQPGSFRAQFFWPYWFIRCILHCPLTIRIVRRRIGTRSAAQVCMAGAVIQASGGFLAAFFCVGLSTREYEPGDAQPLSFFSEPFVCLVSGQAYICRGIFLTTGSTGSRYHFLLPRLWKRR